jgi:hypothetical protein
MTLSEWHGGEHHAKNPLDETAGDYMGIESRLQSSWKGSRASEGALEAEGIWYV